MRLNRLSLAFRVNVSLVSGGGIGRDAENVGLLVAASSLKDQPRVLCVVSRRVRGRGTVCTKHAAKGRVRVVGTYPLHACMCRCTHACIQITSTR